MTLTLGAARTGQKSTGISPAARPTIGRMPSYEPVDLSGICNARVEVLGVRVGDYRRSAVRAVACYGLTASPVGEICPVTRVVTGPPVSGASLIVPSPELAQ